MLLLRKLWQQRLPPLWVVCIVIAIVAAMPRFYWLLHNNYNAVIFIFIFFITLPFILLTREGRRSIGFRKIRFPSLIACFMAGISISFLVYLVGRWLHGHGESHWYVVVMKSFDRDGVVAQLQGNVFLFLAVTLPTMIFSPLGEEFFFRGLLHDALSQRWGAGTAAVADPAFFGVTHLAHYGLVIAGGTLTWQSTAFLWVVLMAASSVLFYQARRWAGSIWGAVACHSGFNFAMMYIIVYIIS